MGVNAPRFGLEDFRGSVDAWLQAATPPVDEVLGLIRELRATSADVDVAQAHLVSYARSQLGAEFGPDPEMLRSVLMDSDA
jgi:hypothetical protein